MTLDDMTLFVAVARAGNFTRAAVQVRVPQATLSRRIAALERSLKVRLFERTTRRVALTVVGQQLLDRCAGLVDEASAIRAEFHVAGTKLNGHVRVSMPVDFGVSWMGEWIPEFLRQYPGITLDLDLSPRYADLKAEPVDLAFRLDLAGGGELIARRVGSISRGLFAAPGYLARHGRPRTPEALASHTCLCLGSAPRGATWPLELGGKSHPVRVKGPLGLNNMSLIRLLAEHDVGVAMLPERVARSGVDSGRLERVLRECTIPDWPVYAVTASRLTAAPVRAVIDFVRGRLDA